MSEAFGDDELSKRAAEMAYELHAAKLARAEIKQAHLLIAVLVQRLGGKAIVSQSDMERVERGRLEVEPADDAGLLTRKLVVRYREPKA